MQTAPLQATRKPATLEAECEALRLAAQIEALEKIIRDQQALLGRMKREYRKLQRAA